MVLAQSVISAARKLRSDYNLQREKPKMFIAVRSVLCIRTVLLAMLGVWHRRTPQLRA